jgi:hypothetical protein
MCHQFDNFHIPVGILYYDVILYRIATIQVGQTQYFNFHIHIFMGEGFFARPIPVILDPRVLPAEIEYIPYCYRRDTWRLCTLSQTLGKFLTLHVFLDILPSTS